MCGPDSSGVRTVDRFKLGGVVALEKDSLGIQRVASVHVFVRDLERSRDHYVNQLDFAETAVSTPEFEMQHRARASVVEAGGARFVFMEPLGSKGESFQWLEKHPEGAGRIVFEVSDVERAYALLAQRGATHVTGMEHETSMGARSPGSTLPPPWATPVSLRAVLG